MNEVSPRRVNEMGLVLDAVSYGEAPAAPSQQTRARGTIYGGSLASRQSRSHICICFMVIIVNELLCRVETHGNLVGGDRRPWMVVKWIAVGAQWPN